MATSVDVIVRYLGDATKAVAAARQTEQANKSMQDKMSKTGGILTASVTAPILAIGALAMKEFADAGKVAAQTNAVIKSTGGAAGISAKEVDRLASSLSKKTGIDDEAIASGENLLLTFKSVHNEAGKGNKVFDRATEAALDLSVAFGKDLTSTTTMVGKALENPIQGISALNKVGVQLTDTQKAQIRGFVESGNVMGAQKIILRELESQVGGSAAAYGDTLAGKVSKAKNALMEAGASIVGVVAPGLELLAKAAASAAGFLSSLPAPVSAAVGVFALLAAALGPTLSLMSKIRDNSDMLGKGFEAAKGAVAGFGKAMQAMSLAQVGAVAGVALLVAGVVALAVWMSKSKSSTEEAADAGRDWGKVQVENARALGSTTATLEALQAKQTVVTAKLRELKEAQEEHQAATASGQEAQNQFGVSMGVNAEAAYKNTVALAGLQAKHDTLAPAIAEAKRQKELDAIAANASRTANEQLASAATGVATATKEQVSAITELNNAYLAAQGGELGYQAAQLQVEAAQNRVNSAVAEFGPASLESRQAANDLAQAKLGVAGAAYTLQANEATLAEQLKGKSPAALAVMRDSLLATMATQGDATGTLQGHIDKINSMIATAKTVPPEKTILWHSDTDKAKRDTDDLDRHADAVAKKPRAITFSAQAAGSLSMFAKGGTVPGPLGRPQLAVVHGGEEVVPPGSARASGGGGSGRTYNLNVSVAPGGDPVQTGREIVALIERFERTSGKRWRT